MKEIVRRSRPLLGGLLVCSALLGVEPTGAPSRPVPTLESLDGEWIVSYADGVLGLVEGRAEIDSRKRSARVAYQHPETGEKHVLESTSLRLEGGTLTIELRGDSPASARLDGTGAPDNAIVIGSASSQIKAIWGAHEAALPIAPLPEIARHRVTLRLKVLERELAGLWSYASQPFLRRDSAGWGRDGLLQLEKGAWSIRGPETWHRPRSIVYGAVVLEDQTALHVLSDGTTAPLYPYPFGASPRNLARDRLIFVFGKELPRRSRDRLELRAVDPGVEYFPRAELEDAQRDPERAKLFERGWQLIRERLPEGVRADFDDLDALVVRAKLLPEVVPGLLTFELNGTEVGWKLLFGDNVGALRVSRPLGSGRWRDEPTGIVYPGEIVQIEVETALALPVRSIPVVVGVDGRIQLYGTGEGVPAWRVADEPRLFRTGLIQLNDAPGAAVGFDAGSGAGPYSVHVRPGSIVRADIGRTGILSVPPSPARAKVFRGPSDPEVVGDWRRWVETASACGGARAFGSDVERRVADEITEVFLNSGRSRFPIPGWVDTKVQVGQHAAMLLLRDTFVGQLDRYRKVLDSLRTDEELLAFRVRVEPLVRQNSTGLASVPVSAPSGKGEVAFSWTFEKSILAAVYDRRIDEIEKWVARATRQALERYLLAIAAAVEKARAVDDCDVEELLALTGYDFDPIVAIAKSKLMLRTAKPLAWIPDRRARNWVDSVAIVADTVKLWDERRKEDREEATFAVMVASSLVSVVGGFVGSGAAFVAGLSADVVDLTFSTYHAVSEKWDADAEVEFARGVSDVVGIERLRRAEVRRRSWEQVIGQLTLSAAVTVHGIATGVPELFHAFQQALRVRRIARGRELASAAVGRAGQPANAAARASGADQLVSAAIEEALAASSVEVSARPRGPAFAKLDEELSKLDKPRPPPDIELDDLLRRSGDQLDDTLAYLDDLASTSSARCELDDAIIAEVERFSDIAAGKRTPAWASRLRPETYEAIRRQVVRRDFVELFDSSVDRLARQLESNDPRRARLALEVLESEPGLSVEAFESQVESLMKRIDEPQGPDFYRGTSPSAADTTRALKQANWHAKIDPAGKPNRVPGTRSFERTELSLYIRDPQGRVGQLHRSYDPTTQTLTLNLIHREMRVELPQWGPREPGPIDAMIRSPLPHPLTASGTPTMQLYSLRMMNWFEIGYGASTGLKRLKISTVVNAKTAAQLAWYKRTFWPRTDWPDIPPEELSRFLLTTHSSRYARETLALAGYRARSARLTPGSQAPMELMRDWYIPTGGESFESFLARHRLAPETRVDTYFDITLDVEPW